MISLLKSTECKIFFRFAGFWIVFAVCFIVMFVMLFAAVIGVTFGVIMAIFGTAVLLFRADFIISGIAPETMLFGGLTAVFLSLFFGMAAVKIGFMASRFFLSTRRHCEKMRERELSAQEEFDGTAEPEPQDDSAEQVENSAFDEE